MSDWVRVYCTNPEVPTVRTLFATMREHGFDLDLGPEFGMFPSADLDATDWTQVEIAYDGHVPFMCELIRNTGLSAPMLQPAIDEMTALVEEAKDSPVKDEVLAHLSGTALIVSFQLFSAMDDRDTPVLNALCNWFVDHDDGLFHADDTGFMRRADLTEVIVEAG